MDKWTQFPEGAQPLSQMRTTTLEPSQGLLPVFPATVSIYLTLAFISQRTKFFRSWFTIFQRCLFSPVRLLLTI